MSSALEIGHQPRQQPGEWDSEIFRGWLHPVLGKLRIRICLKNLWILSQPLMALASKASLQLQQRAAPYIWPWRALSSAPGVPFSAHWLPTSGPLHMLFRHLPGFSFSNIVSPERPSCHHAWVQSSHLHIPTVKPGNLTGQACAPGHTGSSQWPQGCWAAEGLRE